MRRHVGLHVRFHQSPCELLEKAERLNLRIVQSFLHNEDGQYAHFTESERKQFLKQRLSALDLLIAHGAYRINCADPERSQHPALEYELQLANALGCTHIVLHAGAAPTLEGGIDALARLINKFCRQQFDLRLVLENTAFGAPSIGSDFSQFRLLLEKIDKPEKVAFCIDTAHAYAAGYDLAKHQDHFIQLLARTIGIERIAIIHLNDTTVALGSHIDLHAQPGHGVIGIDALRSFATHKQLAHIPLILELPIMAEADEQQILELVNSWDKE